MFAIGEKVKVMGGAFEDFEGTISELRPSEEMVRVTISLYGRDETIEVAVSQLKSVISN